MTGAGVGSGGSGSIDIFLPGLLREAAGGQRSVAVEAATLEASLAALCEAHPRLSTHLFDEQGGLRPHINIFLNDQNVRWLESWDVPVRRGDSVTILQAVSGG